MLQPRFILVTMLLLLSAGNNLLQSQTNRTRPNIILILADDLGYGDLGCYGQKKIKTPHLDRLAAEGMRFTQFYAGTTVCAPSRASLMTGLHTGHAAVRGNRGTKPEGQSPLPDSAITFVNHLRNAGYQTGAFGKWGLGFITSSGDPNKKGFDQFYGYNCQSLAHNYYPDHLWNNHDRIELPGNLKYDSVYSADLIHQHAMQFLEQSHDAPFFLFLPYTLPHGDVIVPHDSTYHHYATRFNELDLAGRPSHYSNQKRTFEPKPHAAFAAMVSRLDRYVGEIISLLESRGISKNTIIMFTSDNGPHRENGGDPEYFDSNGMLRGIKRDLYEGGIRVPFIVSWPGTIKPAVINQPAAGWDLYPTILEAARLNLTENIDGVSLLPTFTKKGKQQQQQYFYWEFHEQGGKQALRYKNWKLVKLNVSEPARTEVELYDLSRDPKEKQNIAAKHPAIVQQLEAMITAAHSHNKDWPLLAAEKNAVPPASKEN